MGGTGATEVGFDVRVLALHLSLLVAAAPCGDRTDPRERALLRSDALFSVAGTVSRMRAVRDLDGDGLGDLVVAGGRRQPTPRAPLTETISVVSSRDGRIVRTLWKATDHGPSVRDWDAGGDVDGDGFEDVILGMPRAADDVQEAGRVEIRSGRDGSVLRAHLGRGLHDELGACVVFLGDVDRDGYAEYATSAPQITPSDVLDERTLELLGADRAAVWLAVRANARERFGFVTVWSGRDGRELYTVRGDVAGQGFGIELAAVGDANGDVACDWIARCQWMWRMPASLHSGIDGARLALFAEPTDVTFRFAAAGDVNSDGLDDLLRTSCDDTFGASSYLAVLSGRDGTRIAGFPLPDWASEFPLACALGDVDCDGYDDVGIGDGNFHLASKRGGSLSPLPWHDGEPEIDTLHAMPLARATAIESNPRFSGCSESGCALVRSGRTSEPIFGAFGDPGSSDGIGLAMAPLPDISGDGAPDIAIASASRIYFFAGPGLDAASCPGSVR